MKKILVAAALASIAFAGAAQAGEGKFSRTSDGFQLHIKCKSAGCTVRGKEKGGKWGMVEKGPGGRNNYLKLVAKYEAQGFK